MDSRRRQHAARVAGLLGIALVATSVAGVVLTQRSTGPVPLLAVLPQAASPPPVVTAAPGEMAAPGGTASPGNLSDEVPDPTAAAMAAAALAGAAPAVAPSVYPLQVGRYWVYRYREPGSDVEAVVERSIIRREARVDGSDLFIFDDGSVVYFEKGRVYEMGSGGGVNIIPVDTAGAPPPVVYRSQGMQIEKWVGAADTTIVVDGRRFAGCLEVVTRFRALDQGQSPDDGVSFSSFYAPGVGMVGRQTWPRDASGSLAVTLADHGTRQL